VRADAARAERSIQATVLAHEESAHVAAFEGADSRDAAGPTVHFPLSADQVEPWAPTVSVTDNASFKKVDSNAETRNIIA